MADTGHILPGTAVNDATVGTIDWVNPTEALTDNATNAIVSVHTVTAAIENSARLVIGGTVAGDNKSTGVTVTSADQTYGGAADLWGLTPTSAQINASDFGFAYSVTGNIGTSKYLMVTNFGFNIPVGATINGIEVFSNKLHNTATVKIDYISIKVYYTEATYQSPFPAFKRP